MIDKLAFTLHSFGQAIDPNATGLPNVNAGNSFIPDSIATILQIVFSIFGAVAVLIIAIAGFQYVVSGGDPQKTARAKDTILYAAIGLVVSVMAFTIVGFVTGKVFA